MGLLRYEDARWYMLNGCFGSVDGCPASVGRIVQTKARYVMWFGSCFSLRDVRSETAGRVTDGDSVASIRLFFMIVGSYVGETVTFFVYV